MIPGSSYSTSGLWEEAARTSILSVGRPLGRWHCCVYCMSILIWENQLVHSSVSHLLKETFETMWEFMHWLNMPARLILCLHLPFKCFYLDLQIFSNKNTKQKPKNIWSSLMFTVLVNATTTIHLEGWTKTPGGILDLPKFIIKSPQRSLSFLHLSESAKSASLV